MGGGSWTKDAFTCYSKSVGRSVGLDGTMTSRDTSAQQMFRRRGIDPALKPYNAMRECRDTKEHPNTIPVILALDVTGSMGSAAMAVAKKLNVIMTDLYNKVKDVEFMVMGIGDLAYDDAPIQASQFESDIRIAEQLDKIYFEGGGGGNAFESYTAAWYFGLHHTDLDCWKRGRKGIIITMGDEPMNPYLPSRELAVATGDSLQADIETSALYEEASEKFDIYHLMVDDSHTCLRSYAEAARDSFGKHLDGQHLMKVTLDTLAKTIVDIVVASSSNDYVNFPETETGNGIRW